jgi:hypothetical protein
MHKKYKCLKECNTCFHKDVCKYTSSLVAAIEVFERMGTTTRMINEMFNPCEHYIKQKTSKEDKKND